MGYIKLMKADGSADLIPAEGVHHVSAPSTSNKDITLAISGSPFKYAVIAGADSADADADLTAASRNGINAAIELANGASGPAIAVDLGTGLFAKTVTITDTAGS